MWEILLEKERALSPEIKEQLIDLRKKTERFLRRELIRVPTELRLFHESRKKEQKKAGQ
jgi:hypothetical protein